MIWSLDPAFRQLIILFNGIVAVTVAIGALRSLWSAVKFGPDCARLRMTGTLLDALSLYTAGTLIATILATNWEALGKLLSIFTLRFVLKWAVQRERRQISSSFTRH